MQELLNNPAVQAGFAPFLVALIVVELFRRTRLSGLAIIAGFAVTVYLASDFNMEPLTAARKIVLLGSISALLALVLTLVWMAAPCARMRSRHLDGTADTPASRAPGCAAVGRGLRCLRCDSGLGDGNAL